MANYKVVFRADWATEGDGAFGWKVGCPLLLEAVQVSRNVDTGKAYLQAKVLNVSAAVVGALKASFEVVQHDGSVERVDSELLDADVAPGQPLNLPAVALSAGDVELVRGRIDWARTPDGTWSASATPAQVPKPQPLGLSEKALGERYGQLWAPLATVQTEPRLRKAAESGLVAGEGWWVCPCGQPNVGRETCASCGVAHERLSDPKMQDPGVLEAAADKREAEAREAARKAKRMGVTIAIVVVVAVVLAAAGIFVSSHLAKVSGYDEAMALFDQEDYAKAGAAFRELGDFSDSQEMAEKSDAAYQIVQENMRQAEREAEYKEAMGAYEQGDYQQAMVGFNHLLADADGDELDELLKLSAAAELGTVVSAYFGDDREAWYFDGKVGSDIRGRECSFSLQTDGTCAVTFSFPKNLAGTWEGTWDLETQQLSLPGFPGGEVWDIVGIDKNNKDEPYLEVQLPDLDYSDPTSRYAGFSVH